MSSPKVTQRFKKMGRNIQAKLKSKQQQHDLLNGRYVSDDLDVVPAMLKRYHIWYYSLNPRKFCGYLIHEIQYGFFVPRRPQSGRVFYYFRGTRFTKLYNFTIDLYSYCGCFLPCTGPFPNHSPQYLHRTSAGRPQAPRSATPGSPFS